MGLEKSGSGPLRFRQGPATLILLERRIFGACATEALPHISA